ncbi:MAG: BamA/TamA family outer membrane protein [Gemmatimonadales bacterium]
MALLTPRLVRAQGPGEPWTFYLIPYPLYNSLEGLSLNLAGGWFKSAPAGPIPVGLAIEPNASLATSGSRTFSLTWENSGRIPGWRLLAIAGYEDLERAPYFGLGNGSVVNDSLESAYGERHYYRYELERTSGIVAIQRRIAGPLRADAGVQWRHYHLEPLGGAPTALGADLARGVTTDTGSYTSMELHGALIFDTRDEEASPSRGLFVAVMVARALKGPGDFDYIRWGADARQFIPLASDSTVVLAFRQSVEIAHGTLPFCIAFERMTIWKPDDGFGGETTLRQNLPGRYLGPNNALGSVDLRYRYWDAAVGLTPIRLWLVAHADAGRVWEQDERFRWSGLHSGYGGGAIAQVGRESFFGVEIGYSPDAHFQFSTTVTLGY